MKHHPVDADRAFHEYLDHGRPEDLATVFDALAPKLLLLANHVAGQPGAAEDVVQATFLRAIELAPRFERGRPVLPWLTGILVLEAKKSRRRDARTPDPHRLTTPDVIGPAMAAELDELRQALEAAIATLPDAYAEVLTLRLVHGLTPTEIAHALRLSPETVKTRIRRGGERLRAKLPASFAAALGLLAAPARSLSTVRDTVLAAANAAAPLAPTGATGAAAAAGATRSTALAWTAVGTTIVAGALVAWQIGGDEDAPEEPLRRTPVVLERHDDPIPPHRTNPVVASDAEVDATPPVATPVYTSIEGRFRDARGPVSGVRVTLVRLHSDALLTDHRPLPDVLAAPRFVAGEAETDAGGRFVIEQVLPGGVWLLAVEPPDGPPFVDLVAMRQAPHERVDIGWRRIAQARFGYARVIEPGSRVVDGAIVRAAPRRWTAPEDSGLLGALLECWTDPFARADALVAVPCGEGFEVLTVPPWLTALRQEIDPPSMLTDARGEFVWHAIDQSKVDLVVEADGFEPEVLNLPLEFDGHDGGDVVLTPLTNVRLRVVDAFDDRVADAEVAVGMSGRPGDPVVLRPVGRTDADGVLVAPLRRAPLVVAVREGPGAPFFATRLPEDAVQIVRLPARHVVKLRCVERSGVPVDGVEIRLLPGRTEDADGPGTLALHQLGCIEPLLFEHAEVDAETGTVTIDGVPGGPWTAVVTAPDHASTVVRLTVSGPTEARVELPRAQSLQVSMIDQGFQPLRGVPLAFACLSGDGISHPLATLIGRSDGDALLTFARREHSQSGIAIAAPGLGWRTALAGEGCEELEVVLREQGALDGMLTSAAQDFDPREYLLVAERVRERWDVVATPPVLIQPAADGHVSIEDLEPGRYRLSARPMPAPIRDFGSLLDLLCEVEVPDDRPGMIAEVAPGSTTSFGFDPVPPPSMGEEPAAPPTFAARLLVDGVPPAGGIAALVLDGQETRFALDETGAFDAGDIAAGTAELILRVPGLDGPVEMWRGTVVVDTEPGPLAIDVKTSPLSALVKTASGDRATGVPVRIEGSTFTDPVGSVQRSLQADAAGFVALDRLPHGSFTVHVDDPERGWLRDRLVVDPTSVTTGVSITLRPLLRFGGDLDERALRVRVPATSELELERIEPGATPLTRIVVCSEGGGFSAERLLPGRYRVTLRAARRMARPDGGHVLVSPALSGIVVPLADIEVPEHDVTNAAITERR